ncbi:MAG: pilus assembly protein TadG [Rhodobacterales bacterium CG15_BIG_FIL_POST_REV_8_21_14_020_59_13]|nr:MAG: pilus assembly protein TadG [Rhodobacterales bacterium CG15_BIG_FIL_POST_REV_8_21_14_020_59_13]
MRFSGVRAFIRDTRGNVAMLFSLMLVPIVVMGGGAVDFNQAMNARARLAESLDAAALAVGSSPRLLPQDAVSLAQAIVAANYPAYEIGNLGPVNVEIDDTNNIVILSGTSRVQTAFLGLIGIDHLTVNWETEVRRARTALELVMVLDNTGSMSGSKISALREAALMLTDILHDNADDPTMLEIGLVPFSSTVNVGSQFERAWWLDPDGTAPNHSNNFNPDANRWDVIDSMQYESWDGCVEARDIPLDVEDVPPSPSNPDTLFLPYFAPDEPSYYSGYRNSYMSDGTSSSNQLYRLMNSYKYAGVNPSGAASNWGCTARPITPLTQSRPVIDNAIGSMIASGTTNIPIGISWGVRVLSPQEPFTEGNAYDDDENIKAMVILTDGENVINGRGNINYSDYSGYGYIREGRLGLITSSSWALRNALNERTEAACAYAREQGIRVYTITFQVSSSSTQDMMRNCASHPSLYFNSPSNEALRNAFELIAGDLVNLRLSR